MLAPEGIVIRRSGRWIARPRRGRVMPPLSKLRSQADALEQAIGLVGEITAQSISLNDFNKQMSALWDPNLDLDVIKDACDDPWSIGDRLSNRLDDVRRKLTDFNKRKTP